MTTVRHRAIFVRIASGLVPTGIYFITGKLGLRLAFVHPSATPIWAPSGISLAALLLFGAQAWPATFAGAFLVNITTTGSVATCLGIASGNTLEAIAGMWLINRFANGRGAFQTPHDTFKFAALAAGPSTMIAATLGATILIVTGYASQADFGPIWVTWWLGDAIGDLLITPLLLVWAGDWKLSWRPKKAAEGGLLFVILITGGLLVFGVGANREQTIQPNFFVCPFCFGPHSGSASAKRSARQWSSLDWQFSARCWARPDPGDRSEETAARGNTPPAPVPSVFRDGPSWPPARRLSKACEWC
jgi:hypothetical protein